MTQRAEEIRMKLKEMSSGIDQVFLATVKEVDETEFFCTVETDTDIQYTDVRLRAVIDSELKGFCFIPKVESLVLVGRIGNSNQLYVQLFSEIEKILFTWGDDVEILFDMEKIFLRMKERSIEITEEAITFNAGDKGSFATDINKLVDKISAIEEDINSLKQVFTTWVPAPMDGGAVLKAASASWAAQVIQPVTTVDSIKDELIKH
ncbi:MAG: hypothetical protein JXQ80_12960 [Bacteroidales bacterium]|nr:hypothetical protein [Bacteroidales bacterium]